MPAARRAASATATLLGRRCTGSCCRSAAAPRLVSRAWSAAASSTTTSGVEPSAATARSALMIIDLQTDYISGGDLVEGQTSPLLAAFPELPVNVERLLAQARAANTPIVHIRERDSEDTSKWLPYWDKLHPPGGVGAGSKCVAEPWAAELEGEPVFIKHCYDAFMSGAASEALLAHLRSLDIERLYMCGARTKACVMFTANSAFTLGFEVCVVGDCCADRSREHHDAVLSTYDGYHIAVVQSADVFPSAPPAAARL
jgi:nicotinamidase-related amidase